MAHPNPPRSVHDAYVTHGPRRFYEQFGDDYRNPHEVIIHELIPRCVKEWSLDVSHVLDLAAGSGEVTLALHALHLVARASCPCLVCKPTGKMPVPQQSITHAATSHICTIPLRKMRISAIDPYTHVAYTKRTGAPCEALTFEQIAAGALRGRVYSLIACSFAMHLVESSRLASLCYALSQLSQSLLILTPHKRPTLRPEWGWTLKHEILHERVRARLYVTPA